MHMKDMQEPALGEMQDTLDVNGPSSPLASEQKSPKVQSLAVHRPPMSVVVIQESTESPLDTLNNGDSQRSWAAQPIVSMGSMDESRESWQRPPTESVNDSLSGSAAPNSFSSFKLKPRNPGPFMASPSRSSRGMTGAARGRKRPAHSISIPAGSISSTESPLRPPRPFYLKDDRSDVSSNKEESISRGSGPSKDTSLSPPIFEMECLNLKSLFLHSPSNTSPPNFNGSRQSCNRPSASSFTMYGASPAGSVTRAANTSTSESTSSSFVPSAPSSTRSSPRHVPLTVLSNGQSLMSPSKNSLVRPPRHGGSASLLFSLDQDDESDDDGMGFAKKPSSTSCNSSISSEGSNHKLSSFSSPSLRPAMYTSPIKTAASSPRTPLPKIMLTPRTPQSIGSRRKVGLPMFPSPSDDDIDTSSTPQAYQSSIDEAMDNLLNGFAKRGHPARFQSTTGYIPTSDKASRYHDSSNSLAYSLAVSVEGGNGGDTSGANLRRDDSSLSGRGMSPTVERSSIRTSPPPLPKRWLLPLPSDSNTNDLHKGGRSEVPHPPIMERSPQPSTVLPSVPTISRHDHILRALMDANARERAAHSDTGSLSDSCEDDEFVLTCPASMMPEVADNSRPPKQRRRETYESTVSNSFFNGGGRESCTSLASGLASASSLFGMEFYQEEGHSVTSPVYRPATSFSSASFKSKNSGSHGTYSPENVDDADAYAPLGMHHRFRRSEHSLGSIGLSLDGPAAAVDVQGRDLMTPPATRHITFTPPPLPSWQHQADSSCFYASSDAEIKETAESEEATNDEQPAPSEASTLAE